MTLLVIDVTALDQLGEAAFASVTVEVGDGHSPPVAEPAAELPPAAPHGAMTAQAEVLSPEAAAARRAQMLGRSLQ